MKNQLGKTNLKTLAIVAIVMIVAAIGLQWNQGRSSSGKYEREKLFGSLKLDQVDRVKIVTPANNISLKKINDEKWVMENRGGYPVESQRLAKLVIGLADIEPIDRMSNDPEKYEKMGVADGKPEMGRVEVLDKDQKVIAGLTLGKPRTPPSEQEGFTPPDGQFVRADHDKAVYLLKDQLQLDTLSETWLVKDVVAVKDAELQSIKVDHAATTESFTMARTGADPFAITSAIPDGYKEKAPNVQNISRALASVTLSDVLAASDPKATEIVFDSKFTATHKNGLIIEVSGGKILTDPYIKIVASYDAAADLSVGDERTSDSVTAKAMPKAEDTVKELNEKHSPWIYRLQSYQYENVMKKLSDAIEQSKIPTEESANGPSVPGIPLAMPEPVPAPEMEAAPVVEPAPVEAAPAEPAPAEAAPAPAEPAPAEPAPQN